MITEASLPLRIHIFRHGETEWSLTGQHTGQTDLPLTAGGEDKARSLGHSLEGIQFAHVLTSPRQRARKTCEMADLELTAGIDADLAEWDYGDYEGQTSAAIVLQRPGWNLYRDGCPHGESPEQVSERADRLIARLRTLEGNVALFSHGQFSAVLAVRWIGMPVAVAQHFPLGTASHSILGSALHHPQVSVIEQWNAGNDICRRCTVPGRQRLPSQGSRGSIDPSSRS